MTAPDGAPHADGTTRHTVIALVWDRPGVLSRVVGLFRRRGFNIASLAVGASETPGLSRMTVAVDVRDGDQVVKQFNRLIEVIAVQRVANDRVVMRETALLKSSAPRDRHAELAALAAQSGARVVDRGGDTLLLEITAAPEDVTAFVDRARAHGRVELARTGCIAMTLGADGLAPPAHFSWQADGASEHAVQ